MALGHRNLAGGCLVLVGADHPVCTYRISAFDSDVTRDVLSAAAAGEALGVVAARTAGLRAVIVDAGTGDLPVAGALPARPRRARGTWSTPTD